MNRINGEASEIKHSRLSSIDVLRGIIMVLMALDHIRGQWLKPFYDPLNLSHTTLELFMTRWITHFCAPLFVLLAGMGIFLSLSNGRSKQEMSKYLILRGILLILIEIFLISKFFILSGNTVLLQVIWVLGCSMILFAGLLWLPEWFLWAFSLVSIFGHNALDKFIVPNTHGLNFLWAILHQSHTPFTTFWGSPGFLLYPLIPWTGVLALGYLFGKIMILSSMERKKKLLQYGIWMSLGFILLRTINIYGNPTPWRIQGDWIMTILSFINCEKYPPSLDFLLMTLGPGLIFLRLLEGQENQITHFFECFGRVPFFFYLIHLPIIIGTATVYGLVKGMDFQTAIYGGFVTRLSILYIAWILVILLLYPLCRYYVVLKKTKDWPWLRYF